jgi:hypothetical protein
MTATTTNEPLVIVEDDPIADALEAGWRLGAPPWCPAVQEVDAPIAEDYPCDLCGGPCYYVALYNRERRSYRAFARCATCRNAVEF